jgi:hypothetical protein
VQKQGNSPEHLRNEVAADQVYRALGQNVPEAKLYETPSGPVKLARYIEGRTLAEALKSAQGPAREALLAKVGEGFAADALLGNYDVIGLEKDNILVDAKGAIWRIDNGGAFKFRAQGKPKTDYGAYPKELWSMRDASINPAAAEVFHGLDIYAIARQAEQLDLPAALEAAPDDLKDLLSERAGNLRDVATKALDMQHDQWKAEYSDYLTYHMMGLREAGVTAALPKEMKMNGEVEMVDENGLAWDHLRTANAVVPKTFLAANLYFDGLLTAVKHVNHHASDGVIKAAQVKNLKEIVSKMKFMISVGDNDPENTAAAKIYLEKAQEALAVVKAVKAGGAYQPVSKLEKYEPKLAAVPATPEESIVTKAGRYMESVGLDIKMPAEWMGGQAGDSWSPSAKAYKYFISQHLEPEAKNVWWQGGSPASAKKAYESLAAVHGADKLERSLTAYHALIQEVLGHVALPYNDREARAIRLVRTESKPGMAANQVTPGKKRTMARGLNESASLVRRVSVSGTEDTVQAVPHSRVTGLYLLERAPEYEEGSFASDYENEITFIPAGVPFNYEPATFTGKETDATQWGLNLDHLRK